MSGSAEAPTGDPGRTLVIVDAAFPDAEIERAAAASHGVAVERRVVGHPAEIPAAVGAAAGLLVQFLPIDQGTITACPGLRVIGRYGVGVDNVDLVAAHRAGIQVIPVPDYAVEEVATHSLALILASWRRLPAADRLVREGRWAEWGTLTPIEPLSEQTLGLVGFGRIGREVARQAAGLFGGIVAHDPLIGDRFAGVEMVALDELLAVSGVVSLHLPLRPETTNLMDSDRLAQMRPGSLLVNVSRGGLVNTTALLQALDAGRPRLAALDVLSREPPAIADPLLAHPAVLFSNHIAWYSTRSILRLRSTLAARCAAALVKLGTAQ